MRQLIAALPYFAVFGEQAIHGANGAVILDFFEQRRINSGGRAILNLPSLEGFQQAGQNLADNIQ